MNRGIKWQTLLEKRIAVEAHSEVVEKHRTEAEALAVGWTALELISLPGATLNGTPMKEALAQRMGRDDYDRVAGVQAAEQAIDASKEAIDRAVAHNIGVVTSAERSLETLGHDTAA